MPERNDEHNGQRPSPPIVPPARSRSYRGAIQTGWQLSFGPHAAGHAHGRLECPALLYDPNVFDVVLVPHALVSSVTQTVNRYMRKQSSMGFRESEARFFGEVPPTAPRRSGGDIPIPVQCPRTHHVHPSHTPEEGSRHTTPDARHMTPDRPPQAQVPPPPAQSQRINPQPAPAPAQPQPTARHVPPPPPPPIAQALQQGPPPPAPQPTSTGRSYYRPSARYDDPPPAQPAPKAPPKARQGRQARQAPPAPPPRPPTPMQVDTVSEGPESEAETEPAEVRPLSPYYNTSGESEVGSDDEDSDEEHDELDDDDDDHAPPKHRASIRRQNSKTLQKKQQKNMWVQNRRPAPLRARASASSIPMGPTNPVASTLPPRAASLGPPVAPRSAAAGSNTDNDDNDVAMICFGERPRGNARSAPVSPVGSSASAARSPSPDVPLSSTANLQTTAETPDGADTDHEHLPPRTRKKVGRPKKRKVVPKDDGDTPERESKRRKPRTSISAAKASPPPSSSGAKPPAPEAPYGPVYTCRWPRCAHTLHQADPREAKAHIQSHMNAYKAEQTREHALVRCLWDGCDQWAKVENLGRHIIFVHLKMNYECPHCGKTLARKDALKRHCQSQHPREMDQWPHNGQDPDGGGDAMME